VTTVPRPAQKRASSVKEEGGATPDPSATPAAARQPQPPPLTREQLEGVRRRDPAALGELFERYFDQVYGVVHRLIGDRPAAEDVTQEVFLKVHRAAHQLDPSRDPGPWLMTIATNACRDLWRSGAWRMSRRSASVEDDPVAASKLVSASENPERGMIAAERERLVQDAIARLPEPLRVSIVLHDYQGLSHQEVATITGVHHAAARKRYSRAIAALGAQLRGVLAP
jgi:RNA polymerase sigma-70 factor (ECF subfamily)